MKAYLIIKHLLVPRSRSSAKVKVKLKVTFLKKWPFRGICVSQTHLVYLFFYWSTIPLSHGSVEHTKKKMPKLCHYCVINLKVKKITTILYKDLWLQEWHTVQYRTYDAIFNVKECLFFFLSQGASTFSMTTI